MKAKIDKVFADTTENLTESLAGAVSKEVTFPKSNWYKLKESGNRAFKADKAAATPPQIVG